MQFGTPFLSKNHPKSKYAPALGLHLCRELGRQAVILMGGVQDNNRMAVRFYLRHGFHRLDSFEWPEGVLNDDMIRWL